MRRVVGAREIHQLALFQPLLDVNLALVVETDLDLSKLDAIALGDIHESARARLDHALQRDLDSVSELVNEDLDLGELVGVDALCVLGYRRHQALRAARKFRRHDEASVHEESEEEDEVGIAIYQATSGSAIGHEGGGNLSTPTPPTPVPATTTESSPAAGPSVSPQLERQFKVLLRILLRKGVITQAEAKTILGKS